MKPYAYHGHMFAEWPDPQDFRQQGQAMNDNARKRGRVRTALNKRSRAALKRDLQRRSCDSREDINEGTA
jgi:hypothetical protein